MIKRRSVFSAAFTTTLLGISLTACGNDDTDTRTTHTEDASDGGGASDNGGESDAGGVEEPPAPSAEWENAEVKEYPGMKVLPPQGPGTYEGNVLIDTKLKGSDEFMPSVLPARFTAEGEGEQEVTVQVMIIDPDNTEELGDLQNFSVDNFYYVQ